jgi:hypothetical protein
MTPHGTTIEPPSPPPPPFASWPYAQAVPAPADGYGAPGGYAPDGYAPLAGYAPDGYAPPEGYAPEAYPAPDDYAALTAAAQTDPPDWELISQRAGELAMEMKPLPQDLVGIVMEAARRIACRERLQNAIAQQSLTAIVDTYEPALLDDWPACKHLVARARAAHGLMNRIRELERLHLAGDGQALVVQWRQHAAVLVNLPEAQAVREQALDWEARLAACDQFLAILRQPTASERELADAWARLEALGGAAEAEPHRARAELAQQRIACLEYLANLGSNSEEADREFVRAWSVDLLAGCAEAARLRERHANAGRRLALVEQLERALALADRQVKPDTDLLNLAGQLPVGYDYRCKDKIEQVRRRIKLARGIGQELLKPVVSDVRVASLWEQFRQAGGVSLQRATVERCQLAVRRYYCMKRLREIDASLPLDEQDQLWLQTWDGALLSGCADAAPLETTFRQATERVQTWREFETALAQKDLGRLKQLATPALQAYPPIARRWEEAAQLLEQAARIAALEELIERGAATPFALTADLVFLRSRPDLFQSRQKRIATLLRQWLSGDGQLTAANPAVRTSADGLVTVRWAWRHFDRISYCRVAVADHFLTTPEEAAEELYTLYAEDHRRAGGGLGIPSFGMRRAYVTVWAVIDLDWMKVVGPPLQLGPVSPGKRPARH